MSPATVFVPDLFGVKKWAGQIGHLGRDLDGDTRHTVRIAVEQIAVADRESTHPDRQSQVKDVAIGMGANSRACEHRIVESFDLQQVASGARGDQPDRAESLVNRTHHLSKRGSRGRIIKILKDHHGWSRQIGKTLDLVDEIPVGISTCGGGVAAKGSGRGKTDHGRQVGERRLDAAVHITSVSWSNVEQFDHIRDRRRVELPEFRQDLGG